MTPPASEDDIKKWLFQTGAPLEMRTARVMFDRGLIVEQGIYYADPDEPTVSREIDVVATCETPLRGLRWRGVFQLSCVIECKQAPTPWVLFRPQHSQFGTQPFTARVASELGAAWLRSVAADSRLLDTPLWHLEDGPGYALSTSATAAEQPDGQENVPPQGRKKLPPATDLAYKAVYAVAKAATSLAASASAASACAVSVLFPVIVIRGQLFEAFLDGGETVVNEISRGKLLWSHPLAPEGRLLIDVVTEGSLPLFADDFVTAGRAALSLGEELAVGVVEAVQPEVVVPRRIR